MVKVYTYREGAKLTLNKKSDEFVVRMLPNQLTRRGYFEPQQTSTHSSRLVVAPQLLEQQMQRCRLIAPTHHAYTTEDGNDFLITDRIYVKYHDEATKDDISELANKYGLIQAEKFGTDEYLYRLTDDTGMNPIKLVVELSENCGKLIEIAENDLNYDVNISNLTFPTDASYYQQWHLHSDTQHTEFDPRSSSNCDKAWEYMQSFGNSSVVVGVTDDGCNLFHHDFNGENKFAGWGYFERNQLVTNLTIGADKNNMYQPGANHGTACAGVIAGEVDGELTVGAAPGVRLLPIKWPSNGPSLFIGDTRLRKMLDYVSDKVDVLSNSWGSSPSSNVGTLVKSKIQYLSNNGGRRGKGVVFLWAAGNENCPIEYSGDIDIPYTMGWLRDDLGNWRWAKPSTSRVFRHNLTELPGVMYVAALASTAQRSHYSNYGEGISICAASSNSHSYHRLDVDGLGITTVLGNSNTSVREDFGGTSSATPLVAGIAALVISANPQLTASEVISILKITASKDLNLDPYPRTSPTHFDPDPSWDVSPIFVGGFEAIEREFGAWSPWFGYGKVDALAAVAKASPQLSTDVNGKNDNRVDIPDNDLQGITSEIIITEAGFIESLTVSVDVNHSYQGDLRILLESPSNSVVLLHGNTGAWRDDIKQTFSLDNTASLANVVGQSCEGIWKLHISDSVGLDLGNLNQWSIHLKASS